MIIRFVSATSRAVTVLAPAKVNVWLCIRGRRSDGYHEIDTLLLPTSLADRLTVRRGAADRLVLTIRGGARGLMPDGRNTVVRAARALQAADGRAPGAVLALSKRTPIGAGLGGGSSDAAAAFVALARLWRSGVSMRRLRRMAGAIGSDVPFFLGDGAARARGRGERLAPVECPRPFHLVLVYPEFESSTREVYGALRRFRPWARRRPVSPCGALRALREGDPVALAKHLHNDLEAPAQALSPRLKSLRHALEQLPFLGVGMSGSGSCYFGICRDAAQSRSLARQVVRLQLGRAWAVTAGGRP